MFSRVVRRRARALVLVPLAAAGLFTAGCSATRIAAHGSMPTGGMDSSYVMGGGCSYWNPITGCTYGFSSGQASFSFDINPGSGVRGWWADSGWTSPLFNGSGLSFISRPHTSGILGGGLIGGGDLIPPVNSLNSELDPAIQQAVGSSLQLSFNSGPPSICVDSGPCLSNVLANCPARSASCAPNANAVAAANLLPGGIQSTTRFAVSLFGYTSQNPNWPGNGGGLMFAVGNPGQRSGPGEVFLLIFSGPYAGYSDLGLTNSGSVFTVY